MERIDFPHVGPDFPEFSSEEVEDGVRMLARSVAIANRSSAPHRFGPIRLERVGFARIPQLIVPAWAKAQDVDSLIPVARQHAFAFLAERGVDDHHLRAVPGVSSNGRRCKFTDQHGQSRFGAEHRIGFDLSDTLAVAADWDWTGRGTLKADWEL